MRWIWEAGIWRVWRIEDWICWGVVFFWWGEGGGGFRVLEMWEAILIRKFCFRMSLLYLATGLKVSSVVNRSRDFW